MSGNKCGPVESHSMGIEERGRGETKEKGGKSKFCTKRKLEP